MHLMIDGKAAWLAAIAIALGFGLPGCASITTGTTQSINVASSPDEADCTLFREGRQLAVVRTPAPVVVSRSARPIRIVCNKPGYNAGESALDAEMDDATMGNHILGGVIGLAVDHASGAAQRYPGAVMVGLTPLGVAPAPVIAAPPAPTFTSPSAEGFPAPSSLEPEGGLSRSRL